MTDYTGTLVLIPALNEAPTILAVVDDIQTHVPGCRIVVVDSYSINGMTKLVEDRKVEILQTPRGGKGLAVRQAFAALREERESRYWVMMDGDWTYPARYIPIVIAYMQDGADIVMGYRKILEENAMPRINKLGNRGLSLLASGLYGAWVFDVCTGLWGFTEKAMGAMRLTSKGFTLEADIFTNAMRTKCRVEQIPIAYRARPGQSKAKLTVWDGFKIGGHLLKGRFKLSP